MTFERGPSAAADAIFARGPATYTFETPANARTARRDLYLARSALRRTQPHNTLTHKANTLVFTIHGSTLTVRSRVPTVLENALA